LFNLLNGLPIGAVYSALYWQVDPHLLAARAFVHAQTASGAGVQNLVSQSRHGATSPAPDFIRRLE
jgi:hypothetical protein